MRFPDVAEIAKTAYGTLRLLRADPQGVTFFPPTPDGAVRSFATYLVTIPAWLWVAQGGNPGLLQEIGITTLHFSIIMVCRLLVSVLFLFLVVERLTHHMQCRDRFPLYVTVQNWTGCYLIVLILFLHTAVPGPWPGWAYQVLDALLILFSWFVTTATLRIQPLLAVGLTLLVVLGQQMVELLFSVFVAFTISLTLGVPGT